jgi:hypothetical protein
MFFSAVENGLKGVDMFLQTASAQEQGSEGDSQRLPDA